MRGLWGQGGKFCFSRRSGVQWVEAMPVAQTTTKTSNKGYCELEKGVQKSMQQALGLLLAPKVSLIINVLRKVRRTARRFSRTMSGSWNIQGSSDKGCTSRRHPRFDERHVHPAFAHQASRHSMGVGGILGC